MPVLSPGVSHQAGTVPGSNTPGQYCPREYHIRPVLSPEYHTRPVLSPGVPHQASTVPGSTTSGQYCLREYQTRPVVLDFYFYLSKISQIHALVLHLPVVFNHTTILNVTADKNP